MSEILRVLLVEDSNDDAELVLRFIRQHQEDIHVLRVQTEAEMKLALEENTWDLVVSDFNLPSFSGMEAIRMLKAFKLEVPLILVSGTIGEDTAVEAVKMGATDYVLKSNLGRLPSSIGRALREGETQREYRVVAEQLVLAQKMEAVGRLAGGVAHDVNNALAAITLLSEVAIAKVELGQLEKAKESICKIIKAQESAARIIRQLLLFSRHRSQPARVIDFSKAVSEAKPLIEGIVGEGIQLNFKIPSQPILVLADSTQIEQVVLNLAVNAKDAMPAGGALNFSIECSAFDTFPPNVVIKAPPGKYVILSVRDTGHGMSPEVCRRIFEPFYTTKEEGRGTGLGLSVIYGILRNAGGTLLANSCIGEGTTFQLYWPVSAEIEDVSSPAESAMGVVMIESIRILVVEDAHNFRDLLVGVLKAQNFHVVQAANGEEALKIIQKDPEEFDLLIADVVMPQMGGPELAKEVRKRQASLRVLFLSGYTDDILEGYEVDSRSTWFLEKPFATDALLGKITEIFQIAPDEGQGDV